MNEKKQIVVIIGLLVVLILVWIFVLHPPKKDKEKDMLNEETGLEFKIILEMADKYLKDKEGVQKFSYEGDNDPFSLENRKISGDVEGAATVASYSFEGLTLKGILWDSQKPLAIINGEVVGEGSVIKGVQVKSIKPDHVMLGVDGEEKKLFIEGVKGVEKNENKKPEMEGIPDEKANPVFVY